MIIKVRVLHAIGMSPLAPMALKMWCLKMVMKDIYRQIERLPASTKEKYKSAMGTFDA